MVLFLTNICATIGTTAMLTDVAVGGCHAEGKEAR